MATTYIKSRKATKGKTKLQTMKDGFDYGKNPIKTRNGDLIMSYECDPATAHSEFLLSKAKYKAITGREQKTSKFIKTYAVFLILFVFIAIICFAAVIVIAYTRSATIATISAQIYNDLRRLGASNDFLSRTVKEQISKVFFMPILTGSISIYLFYAIILFFNDGRFTNNELLGLAICLGIVVIMSVVLYIVYHFTLRKVCTMLGIKESVTK